MKDAVIVPIVYAKALIYRPTDADQRLFRPGLLGMYNYAVEGVTG